MAMYYEGYSEALAEVKKMNEAELLEYLDGLYGRENLSDTPSLDEIRFEAIRQCRRDFTNEDSQEYQTVQFFTELHKVMKKDSR